MKVYARTSDGIYYVAGDTTPPCEDCGTPTLAGEGYKDYHCCAACMQLRDALSCSLRGLHPDSVIGRARLRHVILSLEQPGMYRNMVLETVGNALREAALVRHLRQQRDAGARRISLEF
jgi:hypothetical protein